MSTICDTCDRLKEPFAKKCHYVNCPHRPKHHMPVPVKNNKLRTLWTLPPDSTTSQAHLPFVDLFDGTMPFTQDKLVGDNDVMFFDGGTDVDPSLYGEQPHVMTSRPNKERDAFERYAFKRAQAAGAACLGVCRGAQFLTVMSGGKLVQHVDGHYNGGHLIFNDAGQAIASESSHHQVMWPFEIPHVLIAWAEDRAQEPFIVGDEYGKDFPEGRFPEIIYCKDTRALCIQGHTEWVAKDSEFANYTRSLIQEFLINGKR